MATTKIVTQKFVTKLFSKMDDDIHEMIAKLVPKLSSVKKVTTKTSPK